MVDGKGDKGMLVAPDWKSGRYQNSGLEAGVNVSTRKAKYGLEPQLRSRDADGNLPSVLP